MNVPAELKYSTDHEWAKLEGTRVRIGITDYAQDALGDVVYVQVPAVGGDVKAGESFCATHIVGYFDTIQDMHDVYDRYKGQNVLSADTSAWRLGK